WISYFFWSEKLIKITRKTKKTTTQQAMGLVGVKPPHFLLRLDAGIPAAGESPLRSTLPSHQQPPSTGCMFHHRLVPNRREAREEERLGLLFCSVGAKTSLLPPRP
ncbi:hypothetical protein E2562_001822, partial [Oryza meyeriana var. granulata]